MAIFYTFFLIETFRFSNNITGSVNERDDLASKLNMAAKELESCRKDRESLAAEVALNKSQHHPVSLGSNSSDFGCNISRIDIADGDSDTPQKTNISLSTPQKQFIEILNLSQISEQDFDSVCDKMSKAQSILSQIEEERRLLKKEVKHLRRHLESTREELATVKNNCTEMNRQTKALRETVDQTKELLKESEVENNQMSLDLERAQQEIERIRIGSSKSYNAIISQSQEEICRLQGELKSRDEARKWISEPAMSPSKRGKGTSPKPKYKSKTISMFDISFDTPVASNQKSNDASATRKNNTGTVRSEERFKVEKGKSMFGMFKDMKKSGRKDKIKYRHFKSDEHERA